MKQFFRHMVIAGVAAALLGCGSVALAAETPDIRVQLNGEDLAFTDAVPQVKDERTFLPFRAVFEAMGAQVDWSADTGAITASRDETTVTMTPGSTAATVEKAGISTRIDMGVAPYAAADENGVWRTYVPVRFAAQAFDCAVGWDQEAYTAIIVDTDKLVKEALKGKEFTYLEKLADYSKKYSEGIWDMEMTMDGSMTMLGAEIPMTANVSGIMADETKMEMDMSMTMDMSQMMALAQQMGGGAQMTEEDQAMIDALATEGMGIAMRGDLEAGKFYMNLSGQLLETAGMSADTWFSMDMNALMAQAGMDTTFAELMQAGKDMDFGESISKAFLNTMTPVSADNEGYGVSYQTFKDSAESLAEALSDKGFQKDGDQYTIFIDGEANGYELTLTMKNGKVTGYSIYMGMTTGTNEGAVVEMAVTLSMDEKDRMTGKLTMNMAPMMTMDFDITGGYTKGKTTPQTEPPEGAKVVDLADPDGMNAALGIMPLE